MTEPQINVAGMPEFDAMLDHIYEYGTASEGIIDRANAFARAIIAQARAELIAELKPVAWRYQTPTGWHTTADAGKAVVLREYHPVEPLAIIPTKENHE